MQRASQFDGFRRALEQGAVNQELEHHFGTSRDFPSCPRSGTSVHENLEFQSSREQDAL
jgi:hypothetical protein